MPRKRSSVAARGARRLPKLPGLLEPRARRAGISTSRLSRWRSAQKPPSIALPSGRSPSRRVSRHGRSCHPRSAPVVNPGRSALQHQEQRDARHGHHHHAGLQRAVVDRAEDCSRMLTTATGSVNFAPSLSRISGAKKSFHDARNANSPTVMSAGRTPWSRIRAQRGEGAAAVDQRRLLELARQRLERVAHHEHRERQLEHDQHEAQAEQRVLQADPAEHDVERDQDRRVRAPSGSPSVARNSRFLPGKWKRANA